MGILQSGSEIAFSKITTFKKKCQIRIVSYLEMASTLCYNRGCGKKFNPRNNPEGSCQYHPGAPKFHEGYKGWTCCEKRLFVWFDKHYVGKLHDYCLTAQSLDMKTIPTIIFLL